MGGSGKWCKEYVTHEQYGRVKNTVKGNINYSQQHISLIHTIHNKSTKTPPKPHANDPIVESVFTVHNLDDLTTIFNTMEPSENTIKVKIPYLSKMESTQQSQLPLHNLSRQAKYTEMFSTLNSSLISVDKLCDDECIFVFHKHKVMVIKRNENIIEVYQDPMNGLWSFPFHYPSQVNQQSNMIAQNPEKHQNTSKQWCQHNKLMASRHPRAYFPTSQQYLTIF